MQSQSSRDTEILQEQLHIEKYMKATLQSQQHEEREGKGFVTQEPVALHPPLEVSLDNQEDKEIKIQEKVLHKNQHPRNQQLKFLQEHSKERMLLHKNQWPCISMSKLQLTTKQMERSKFRKRLPHKNQHLHNQLLRFLQEKSKERMLLHKNQHPHKLFQRKLWLNLLQDNSKEGLLLHKNQHPQK